tara:strand:+ start:370 stop:858 length:489 start_codon:yes stop_codon:yes gene_type:complete
MGRNEILIEFWQSEEVNKAFSKMHPIELQDDLKSEVFLILAELPDEKLINLYDKKELRFYVVRIMLNLVQNSNNQFYKKYRNFVEYSVNEIAENHQEDLTSKVQSSIQDLHWYKKELLRLYTEEFNCNAKALSRDTGIPYMSIIRTLNITKSELKSKIRNND